MSELFLDEIAALMAGPGLQQALESRCELVAKTFDEPAFGVNPDWEKVTRLEVIEPGKDRVLVLYGVKVDQLSLQDDGRTMKLFIRRPQNNMMNIRAMKPSAMVKLKAELQDPVTHEETWNRIWVSYRAWVLGVGDNISAADYDDFIVMRCMLRDIGWPQ